MTQIDAIEYKGINSFLRWQVRVPEYRYEYYAKYEKEGDDAPICGYEKSADKFKVQRLIGWGYTKADAVRMAIKSL